MNNHEESLAVRKVLADYTTGAYEKDLDKLRGVFHPDAVMNGRLGSEIVAGTPEHFLQDIATSPSMKEEGHKFHAEIESIRIEGEVASVILSETGFMGSATIVDFFHLAKDENGQWKILSKTFTTL